MEGNKSGVPTLASVRQLTERVEAAEASGDSDKIRWATEVRQKGGCDYDGPSPKGIMSEEQAEEQWRRQHG